MINIANQFSNLIFLLFVVGIPCYAACKKINVFETFIEGAKQGFTISINILPYLIAMFVAIGMLRASGFFELLKNLLAPLCSAIGMPTELIPLALIRPFSGSASNGILAELIHEHGGNALLSKMAATMIGSTETTFYVVAIYFGSIAIKKTRHTIPAGLIAELAAVVSSVVICNLFFH